MLGREKVETTPFASFAFGRRDSRRYRLAKVATYTQQEARKQCIHAFATSAVFDRRVRALKLRLRLLDFVGIAVPLAVGGMAMSGLTANADALKVLGAFLTVQLVVFAWAAIANWGDAVEQASESRTTNREFGEQYRSLIVNPPVGGEWETIEAQRLAQERSDEKAGVKQNELRYGMRYALKLEQFPCASCGDVPKSMVATKCDNCGNFWRVWGS